MKKPYIDDDDGKAKQNDIDADVSVEVGVAAVQPMGLERLLDAEIRVGGLERLGFLKKELATVEVVALYKFTGSGWIFEGLYMAAESERGKEG